MSRSLTLNILVLSMFAAPSFAALEMTIQCTPQGNAAVCNATTTYRGPAVAMGTIYTGFMADVAPGQVTFSNFSNSLGLRQCFDSGSLGGAASIPFVFCFDLGRSLPPGASFNSSVTVTSTGMVHQRPDAVRPRVAVRDHHSLRT